MKKLQLNLQQIEGAELLTREQLKRVLGGDIHITTITPGGTSSIRCKIKCYKWNRALMHTEEGNCSRMVSSLGVICDCSLTESPGNPTTSCYDNRF